MELPTEMSEDWKCPICLEVLYKPCVNSCGHVFCFWCMHKAMDPFTPSHCPLCRSEYAHFPQVCEQLHFFLQEAFPAEYDQRELDTKEEEVLNGVYSLELQSLHRHQNEVPATATWTPDCFECAACNQLLYNPVVLNCGHAVCQATCRPKAGGSEAACPHCAATIVGDPAVCTQWQEQLVKLLPEPMRIRAAQCKAAEPCSHAAIAPTEQAPPAAAKPEIAERQPQPPPQAGSSSGGAAPTGSTAASFLRQRLLHNIRQDFIHHGVGCDSCGLYPIKGNRYSCQDCPDRVGFDLCGKCYDRGLHITGRFNQQHTPEHKMGLVNPQPTVFHIFQLVGLLYITIHTKHCPLATQPKAANPELSMAQIQQLTALAFARDDLARPPQPPTPAPASQSDASHNDGPSGNGFESPQGDPTQSPSVPPSGQGNASGSMTSGALAGALVPAGSSAAAAAVRFAHARSDGSEWASGFIAEARQQNEANSDAPTGLSNVLRRSRDRAQSILSPGRWFGSQPQPAPLPSPAPSDSQPTPLPAFLAQAQQHQPASQAAAQRAAEPAVRPAVPRSQRGTQQPSRQPASRSTHNTEWRWNLGGPSSSGQSNAQQHQGNASGSETPPGWRWNLGGAWQPSPAPPPVPPQSRGQALTGPQQAQGHGHSQALARDSLSSTDGGGSQRPWQRRRMQAEPSNGPLLGAEGPQEGARAEGSFSQAWRRLVPRFLRRGDSSQAGQESAGPVRPESPAPGLSQLVPSAQQGSTRGDGQQPATAIPAAALLLPEVPNVWDEMEATAEAGVALPEEVQFMEGDAANNLANDAMLLIMHAVQARSQGRSLAEERRASTEHYWRQAEEREEARLFQSARDGGNDTSSA